MAGGTSGDSRGLADIRRRPTLEDTGEESLPLFYVVPERAVGGTWGAAHLDGNVVHGVSVSSVVGCVATLWLVAVADDPDETNLLHPRPLGHPDADTRRHPVTHQHGSGLLDLSVKTTGPFLRVDHRDNCRRSTVVGVPRGSH